MTLTEPLFLIGLVAAAIPVIVHLFNFRRYRKVYFSNVEQLEQIQTETRRQSTLRQLLIMFCRIMAIVFLVLAFARPVIPNRNSNAKSGANDISIYIDNSFSMESSNGSTNLLELATAKAREIVAAYGPTDRFQLITNDIEGRHFHWVAKDEILLLLDDIATSSASPTLSAMVRKQFDFLRTGSNANKQAFVISDFQSTTADIDNLPDDSTISTTLVPLKAVSQNNIYIDSLALNAPAFYRGNSVAAEVWLHNDGDEDLTNVPITLFANNRQRALATIDLPARASASALMRFTIEDTGIVDGRIETTDYPVTFDDKYYFTLNIRSRIRMLTVEGGSANPYLSRLYGGDSSISYSTVSLRQIDFSHIDNNDIILLDELPTLTTGMAQSLRPFVEAGGTLVIVPSNDADESGYNETLRLMAAPQLAGRVKQRTQTARIDTDNALFRNVFASKAQSNIELPTVTDYHRLSVSANTLQEPIISLNNGDNYLCSTPCGEGRIYLFAAPLRDENTDFVRQALFVPTLYNMALYSIRPTPPASTLGDEHPIPLTKRYDNSRGSVKLTSAQNDFEEIPDIRHTGNTYSLVPHGTLKAAGNYRLAQDNSSAEGLSFNYSRRESQMAFTDRAEISKLLKDNNKNHYTVLQNAEKPLDKYIKELNDGRQLWRWCIVLALLMLAIETALLRLPQK